MTLNTSFGTFFKHSKNSSSYGHSRLIELYSLFSGLCEAFVALPLPTSGHHYSLVTSRFVGSYNFSNKMICL
jgi:hypothetical protein